MKIRQWTFEPTCVCPFKQSWVQNRLLVDTKQPSPYLTASSLQLLVSDCDTLCSHTISVDNWRISRAFSEQIRLSAPIRNPQFCNRRSDDPLRPATNVFQLLVPVVVHVNWTPEFFWKQILCCQSNTTVFLHLDTATCCDFYWPASGQLCKAF